MRFPGCAGPGYNIFSIFDRLGRCKIGFASVKEPAFDLSSPTGRFSFAAIADMVNDRGWRTRAGRRFSKDTVTDRRRPYLLSRLARCHLCGHTRI